MKIWISVLDLISILFPFVMCNSTHASSGFNVDKMDKHHYLKNQLGRYFQHYNDMERVPPTMETLGLIMMHARRKVYILGYGQNLHIFCYWDQTCIFLYHSQSWNFGFGQLIYFYHYTIFHALFLTSSLKSMFLLNFPIQWSSNWKKIPKLFLNLVLI